MIAVTLAALVLAQANPFPNTEKKRESPRNMVAEIRLGSYYPWVDRTLDCQPGQCPYARVLKGAMLLVELEVERQLFQAFGSAAIGFSFGYAEKYGHAVDGTNMTTSEATSLRILPMKVLGVYRWDWAAQKYNVPLVPYVKLGFQVVHWWTTSASGTEIARNLSGAGWSMGILGAGGLAFLLDVLDQRLARDFDNGIGVNHTYLFAEYNIAEVNNFGIKQRDDMGMPTDRLTTLDLSARYFMFGLAFEY